MPTREHISFDQGTPLGHGITRMMGNTGTHIPLFLLVLALAGCDQSLDQRVRVAGTVFIDGQPLTSGTIRFVPAVGRPASSAIMADGSFDLASDSVNRVSAPGVPRGNYRVQVAASKIVDDETIHWNAPQRYADFRTSGLVVDIEEPTDDLKIELTWAGDVPSRQSDEIPATDEGKSKADSPSAGKAPRLDSQEGAQ